MKRLGMISREWKELESQEKKGLDSILSKNFEINYFHWGSVRNNIAREVSVNGARKKAVLLSDFNVIYLNSLGAIEGVEREIKSFITNLNLLPGVIINNPKTMLENFDKEYLLRLQKEGIPTIPTEEVSNLSYDSLRFNYKGNKVLKPKKFGERSSGVWKLEEIDSKKKWDIYRQAFPGGVLIQPYMEEILEGEKSFVYVGDEFSHGIRRARDSWQENTNLKFDVIYPTSTETSICNKVLKNWPTKYHVTRFDIIGTGKNPLISEIEMINPNLWLGKELGDIDNRFGHVFLKYVNQICNSQ